MKKIIAILLISGFIFSSCSEDDAPTDNQPKTTTEKIQQKWDFVSIIDFNYEGENTIIEEIDTIYTGLPGEYFHFRTDNKLEVNFDGDTELIDYSIVGDTKVFVDGDEYEITTLTETDFVLTFKDREDNPWYDNVITLKR